jgi:serine phosphatase RsbU (regulator of sigma subunit)/putative methionine-R-sulfoxide reductase with GAF domain
MLRLALQPPAPIDPPVFWLALLTGALALLILVYIYLRRRASRRQLIERVAELEALSSAGRALVASELDVDALIELIAGQAGQIIDTSTFQIGLFDEGFYEIRHWHINDVPQPTPQCFDLRDDGPNGAGTGLMGWVYETGQPLLVRDFQRELDRLPARPRYISDDPPRSALFIPLISGEQTIGVIAAQSDQPNRFSDQDLRRLNILANQAAAAIANGRLYSQEQMRVRHLQLVGQIARQVNAMQDLDDICEQVVSLTQDTFGFYPVNIIAVNSDAAEAFLQASSLDLVHSPARHGQHVRPGALLRHQIRFDLGRGLVGAAATTRQSVVVNNTADDARFLAHLDALPLDAHPATQSEIVIPMIVNDELLGVLDVQSPQLNAFGPAEQMVLEALAAEVANAIYKAQQLTREQEQAWMTTAQLQVAEAISRSRDLDEMYANVARLIPLLTGVTLAGFLLWDGEDETYQGTVLVNASGDTDESFDQLELEIGDWGALDAIHVGGHPLSTAALPAWLRSPRLDMTATGCLRLYPLLGSQDQPLGVLLVGLDENAACEESRLLPGERASARRREELRAALARQTAQAMESAQLRIAQQEEAWVNTALLQVAEAVSSLTELNDILDSIVRLVPLLVGVDTVFVLVWDTEQHIFRAGPSYGVSAMGRGLVETLEIDREEFLIMSPQLAADFDEATGRVPASSHYPLRVPTWLQTVMGTNTAYSFTLVAGGRLVGAMIVGLQNDAKGKRPFSIRRANILNGIAQQAATAVVNNQLYQESAERWRLQQELDVAHNIQSSFLPDTNPNIPGCSVASHWQAARQVSGDFFDFLPLGDDRWGLVIADVADKGVPAALFMALSRTILRTVALSRNDPAQVLMRANEIIGREARSDLFVTMFYSIWDPAQQRLTYANAGHNPPLLMQANGLFRELPGHGMALGVIPEIQLKSNSAILKPSETIIMYTDGVTEALNEDFDEFGMERLKLAARQAARQDAAAVLDSITDSVGDHVGGTPQFDDITLIILKRDAEQANHSA